MIDKINKIALFNLIIFLTFIFQLNAEIYDKRYDTKLEKKIEIHFDRNNLKKYYKHLSNISGRDKVFLEVFTFIKLDNDSAFSSPLSVKVHPSLDKYC